MSNYRNGKSSLILDLPFFGVLRRFAPVFMFDKIMEQELTTKEIVKSLASTVCACGKTKQYKMSHCRKCYYSLPGDMRQALYRPVGKGYEEAYTKSLEYLSENQND